MAWLEVVSIQACALVYVLQLQHVLPVLVPLLYLQNLGTCWAQLVLGAPRPAPPASVPPFPAHKGQQGPHSQQGSGSDVPKVTQHSGGPSSPAACSQTAPLTLQVLIGGEAAHEAIPVEVWGPLLQLRPLVLYHLLTVWAAGLERCDTEGAGVLPSQIREGRVNPTQPLIQPLSTVLSTKLLQAPSLLQGGRAEQSPDGL